MSQITTHILDTALGRPAENIEAVLYRLKDKQWLEIGNGTTNADGRVPNLYAYDDFLPEGSYRITFATAAYFEAIHEDSFLSIYRYSV